MLYVFSHFITTTTIFLLSPFGDMLRIQGHTGKIVAEAGFKPRWSNLTAYILTIIEELGKR